ADSHQGHDAAVHFVWRVVRRGGGARHGHAAGADAAAASRGRAVMMMMMYTSPAERERSASEARRVRGVRARPSPSALSRLDLSRSAGEVVVIAAGGTGGHFFPAEALASELVTRGRRIALMTDARSAGLHSEVFA